MNLLELCLSLRFTQVFWSFVFSGLWHSSGSGFTNECHFLNTHIPQWTSIAPNGTGLEVTLSDVTTVDSVCYQVLSISFTPDLCITLWATSPWRSPCWAPNHVTGSDVTQLVMMLSSIFLAVVIESKWHNRLWSYIASFWTCCRRDCCQKTCTISN